MSKRAFYTSFGGDGSGDPDAPEIFNTGAYSFSSTLAADLAADNTTVITLVDEIPEAALRHFARGGFAHIEDELIEFEEINHPYWLNRLSRGIDDTDAEEHLTTVAITIYSPPRFHNPAIGLVLANLQTLALDLKNRIETLEDV